MALHPELCLPSDGRWPEILGSFGGLSAELFDQQFHDCPTCNAPGAFKYDMQEDPGYTGTFPCNGCGSEERQGGACSASTCSLSCWAAPLKRRWSRSMPSLALIHPTCATAYPSWPACRSCHVEMLLKLTRAIFGSSTILPR